jgi:hypothetical protein
LYGFHTIQHLADQRVNEVGVTVVETAIAAALTEHNRQIDALVSLFAEPTTDYQASYQQAGVRRLQPGDEFARAFPTRAGNHYDTAYPLQRGLDALGFTYESSIKATVAEVQMKTAEMMMADARWMRDHILAAILDNTSWTFTDDQYGSLTVKPMANGDTDTYLVAAGADAGATDNHYLAQTAAIADATNPYPKIKDELLEHPENGGEVVAVIPSGLTTTTRALATFEAIGDPNIRRGADESELVGSLGMAVPGAVIGYHEGVWIVEWRNMPSNTIVAVATDGNRPLRMRQHAEAELQGFKRDAERNDHPWYETQWARRAGFGGWNRVGAVAYQVSGGDTTYDIPTGYTTPMP